MSFPSRLYAQGACVSSACMDIRNLIHVSLLVCQTLPDRRDASADLVRARQAPVLADLGDALQAAALKALHEVAPAAGALHGAGPIMRAGDNHRGLPQACPLIQARLQDLQTCAMSVSCLALRALHPLSAHKAEQAHLKSASIRVTRCQTWREKGRTDSKVCFKP